jgi:hypothetical protein
MLPESMYKSLDEGRLPKIYPSKTYADIGLEHVKDVLRLKDSVGNKVALVRPLAVRKAVAITGSKFTGYRTILRNAYVGKSGDKLTYEVDYKNQLNRPTMAKITQKIGDVQGIMNVLFMPGAPYTFTVQKDLVDPASLQCSAEVTSELGYFKYDSISQTYNVGVFDDRYKPVSEYPVSGADNVVLDIAYSWNVQNTVYPTPLPSELSFTNMSVSYKSGFILFEGKQYKDPAVNNTVRVYASIKNNSSTTLHVENWGFPLSVLYDDNQHVSQAQLSPSFGVGTVSTEIYSRKMFFQADATISFTVKYPDGTVAPGATVKAMDMWETTTYASAVTDANGRCSITLPQGDYMVHAEKSGYSPSYSTYYNFSQDTTAELWLRQATTTTPTPTPTAAPAPVFPKDLSPGETYSYYAEFNLPTWAYGKIGVAHALKVYKGGMPLYFGGPFYCFEVFRLRLP